MEANNNSSDETRRVCIDCGSTWTLGAGESQFYRDRNLEQPRRCSACRMMRRREKEQRGNGNWKSEW